jgi:SAM-dependent methyltransferase
MHGKSHEIMQSLVSNHLRGAEKLKILDVGSYDINGSYKDIFTRPGWSYLGLDIEAGPNVDIVTEDHYSWPFGKEEFDIVVSGQCLEHTEAPWEWVKEISRVCKVGGKAMIVAPWGWPEHKHPKDCWRIFPDGMRYLLTYAGFQVIDCGRGTCNINGIQNIGDTWGVGLKQEAPKKPLLTKLINLGKEILK